MRTNTEFRELVEELRSLHGGMERLALRPAVDKAYRSYKFGKWLPGIGGAVMIGLLLTSGYIAIERYGIKDPVEQDQTIPDPQTGSSDIPDSLTLPVQEGTSGSTQAPAQLERTDTVVMIMRDGRLVPLTEQDTIGKRVFSKVITVPIEGSSPQELKARLDSLKGSGSTYSRSGLQKISADSLQKLFGGDISPQMD
jgi:hypothetical protein